jgi:DNA-binding CsgD family transcriptional regulator
MSRGPAAGQRRRSPEESRTDAYFGGLPGLGTALALPRRPCGFHRQGRRGAVTRMLRTPRRERDLTPRENEVLKYVAEGWTSKEIAVRLQISPKTVEVFRQNLLRKGGAKNSVQLVLTARARGWLVPEALVPEV